MWGTTSALSSISSSCPIFNLSTLSSQSSIAPHSIMFPSGSSNKVLRLKKREYGRKIVSFITKAVNENENKNENDNEEDNVDMDENEEEALSMSPSRDEKARLERLASGKKVYQDEYDVITFLQCSNSNDHTPDNAKYLWNKIAEIPEERRHRLLKLLNRRLVRTAWHIAVARYELPDLAKLSSSTLLSGEEQNQTIEFWSCRKTGGGTMPFALVKNLKKVLFRKDGTVYGRLYGNSLLGQIATLFKPLYFTVKQVNCVVPTREPCDMAYDFGDGLLDVDDYPEGFPKPAKHPWPFKDQAVIYVRHVGPGVMIGQAWIEGRHIDQVPEKLCNEILMVKDFLVAK